MTDCTVLPRPRPVGLIRMWWPWRGSDAAWLASFESEARGRYGNALRRVDARERLTYLVDLSVIGRDEPVPVRVEFCRYPGYFTYDLNPIDYPRVFADERALSPHRLSDDSLCLYHPLDPQDRRWTADQGLDELLNLTARHLLAEDFWRDNDETWPFEEVAHGPQGTAI